MPVKEADPAAVPLEAAFAAAMSGTAKPREVPSPPDLDPDAPHGRGEDGTPNAPFGYTKDGSVRKTAAGRRPNDQARVATPAATAGSPQSGDENKKPELEQKDFTGPLAETSEAIWVGLTFLSMTPLGKIPVIGALPIGKDKNTGETRKLRSVLDGMETNLAAQAAIFNHNRGALVAALNIAANNSARARRFAEKLETGDATWVLMCGAMMMPFVSQSSALWGNELAENDLPPATELAAVNKRSFDGWIDRFNAQLAAAAAAANESITGPETAKEAA